MPEINLAVVYLNVITQHETAFHLTATADELREFFELQCSRYNPLG